MAAVVDGRVPDRCDDQEQPRWTSLTGYRYHGAETEIRPTDHGFDEELVCEIKGVGNGANLFPYVFRTQPISWLNVKQKRLLGDE